MGKKRKRCADSADGGCADQPVLCGSASVGVLGGDDADDEAAGDHAGDPGRMIVALWSRGL